MNMSNGNPEDVGPDVLATWLRNRLKELDWQQKRLADRSGLSNASISDLLSAKQALTAESAEKLAKVFELRVTAPQLLRKAGALKSSYIEPGKRELALNMFESLTDEGQELVLDFMSLIRQREGRPGDEQKQKRKK